MGTVRIACLLYLFSQLAHSQELLVSSLTETQGGGNKIFRYDNTKNQWVLLYQNDQYFFNEYHVSASPNDEYIAMLGIDRGFFQTRDGSYYQKTKMVVLDKQGREVLVVDSTWRYAWGPDGKQIACIIGVVYEGKSYPKSERLQVHDLERKTSKNLGACTEVDLAWAPFDSLIYTKGRMKEIYKYNPKSTRKEKTEYKGIYFSPDGEYYFDKGLGGTITEVYSRADNRLATPQVIKKMVTNFVTWLPDTPSVLLVGDFLGEKAIVDVETGISKKKIQGHWLGYDKGTKEIIIKRDNLIERVSKE